MPSGKQHSSTPRAGKIFAMLVALVLVAAFPIATLRRAQKRSPETTASSNALTQPVVRETQNVIPEPLPPPEADSTPDVDKATAHLTRGNQLLAMGQVKAAIAEYRLAAKFNPEDEDAQYNLGLALAKSGNTVEAKIAYEEALKLYPDYVEAHNNLGNLLVNEGDREGGMTHFRAALELDPNNASAHNNLGNALARASRYEEAIVHFEKAVAARPDYVEARVNIANAYFRLNRTEEAARLFREILSANPNYQPAVQGLSRITQRQSHALPSPK